MRTTAGRTTRTSPPAVLTNAFYAFYDLHRPAYYAFAEAHLSAEEARVAVAYLFSLVADNWTSVVNERCPSAWAWERHTQVIARRSGHTTTPVQDVSLLHDQLLLSIGQIAALTGTEAATVAVLLAAADREAGDRTGRARIWDPMVKPVASNEARWRRAFRLRTAVT
ncbi:hypothetical protein [Streptomyces pakalii]|uniref:Uncharacterized protein n=1 Tax=Streptomyces pakalii TaxID=3036494 RepID=A0ABT7DHV5_9ACTN|nr:hypothetical protein [Streptomyces pakalii]MDJ1645380.1 hypothetical protein [Streptomyces pakalii]